MGKNIAFVAAALLLVLGMSAGCSGDDTDGSSIHEGEDGGTAGASGSGHASPVCTQMCQDYLVGVGLDQTILLLFNQNVTGKPGGSVDLMGACSLGGTAHITGTTDTTTDGTSTLHLSFELEQCKHATSSYSLTFDGTVRLDGTFNNGSSGAQKFSALTVMSSAVQIAGTLKILDEPTLDITCDVAATQQQSGAGEGTLDGQVCGREFSSNTAYDDIGGSGGGSGASGAAAGGGGSGSADECTCYCGWPEGTTCIQHSDCPDDTSVPGTRVPGACGKPTGCSACSP